MIDGTIEAPYLFPSKGKNGEKQYQEVYIDRGVKIVRSVPIKGMIYYKKGGIYRVKDIITLGNVPHAVFVTDLKRMAEREWAQKIKKYKGDDV